MSKNGEDGAMGTVIIGGSISGLMAAHRFPVALVIEQGSQTSVMPMLNATFYAHERVPKFAEQEVLVRTVVRGKGTARDYAKKVYGDWDHPVSMDHIEHEIKAWKWDSHALLADVSERILWQTRVVSIDLDRREVYTEGKTTDSYEPFPFHSLIVTIPLPALLRMIGWTCNTHFRSAPIWLQDVDFGNRTSVPPINTQLVTYCPSLDIPYYRSNQMGGSSLIEYEYSDLMVPRHIREGEGRMLRPGKIWPHPQADDLVEKLHHFGVFCVGRYACWEPKMLSHHAWRMLQGMEA